MGRDRVGTTMRTRTLLALLLLIPLSDALLLVVVAQYIDLVPTVALVVLTGLVGMLLVRAEGRHTLRNLQTKFARGDLPTNELMDGGLLIAAGAFLLTPGLVTDTIGFLIAIPVTRYPIREVLKRVVVKPYLDKQTDGFVTGNVWTAGFPQEEFGDDRAYDTGGDGVYDADPDSYRFGGQDSE
ncbi:membrane protein FxsA [Haloferax sp. MBLA0078]|uniref:Membrane protein FxsA n=2 Tax=Haloferacaceae TaxID=1644056 RepID=A0A6A8G8R2_9EURY|nr:membrane protein FxsA [Haloferax sp. CBA1150]MRW97464.1 membrane protein FxsA [Haloferax marinum]